VIIVAVRDEARGNQGRRNTLPAPGRKRFASSDLAASNSVRGFDRDWSGPVDLLIKP